MKRKSHKSSVAVLVPLLVFLFAASAQSAEPVSRLTRSAFSVAANASADAALRFTSKTVGAPGSGKNVILDGAQTVRASYAYLNRTLPGRHTPEALADAVFVATHTFTADLNAFAFDLAAEANVVRLSYESLNRNLPGRDFPLRLTAAVSGVLRNLNEAAEQPSE